MIRAMFLLGLCINRSSFAGPKCLSWPQNAYLSPTQNLVVVGGILGHFLYIKNQINHMLVITVLPILGNEVYCIGNTILEGSSGSLGEAPLMLKSRRIDI